MFKRICSSRSFRRSRVIWRHCIAFITNCNRTYWLIITGNPSHMMRFNLATVLLQFLSQLPLFTIHSGPELAEQHIIEEQMVVWRILFTHLLYSSPTTWMCHSSLIKVRMLCSISIRHRKLQFIKQETVDNAMDACFRRTTGSKLWQVPWWAFPQSFWFDLRECSYFAWMQTGLKNVFPWPCCIWLWIAAKTKCIQMHVRCILVCWDFLSFKVGFCLRY